MELSKEQTIISERANVALCVFDFIVNLPSPIAEFVYKRILDNAYNVASALTADKAMTQLIEAISCSFESSASIMNLLHHLNIRGTSFDTAYKDINENVCDNKKLCELLKKYCSFDELPKISGIVQSYSCFRVLLMDGNTLTNLSTQLLKRLGQVYSDESEKEYIEPRDQSEDDGFTLTSSNCFRYLGYQTFFYYWVTGIYQSKQSNDCFLEWFCKGKILAVVIDAMCNGGVYYISESIKQLLLEKATNNNHFAKVLNEQYNRYMSSFSVSNFSVSKNLNFQIQESNNIPQNATVPTLKRIEYDNLYSDKYNEFVADLYKQLSSLNFLIKGIGPDNLQQVFSGIGGLTVPMQWLKTGRELSYFLYVANGYRKLSNEDGELAANAFYQIKDYKKISFSSSTLTQGHKALEDDKRKINKIFNKVAENTGIKEM